MFLVRAILLSLIFWMPALIEAQSLDAQPRFIASDANRGDSLPNRSKEIRVSVKKLLPTRYGYSNVAVTEGRLAFVSGQISEDEHGSFIGSGDFAAQTAQVFQNLQAILTHLGATQSDVVKINYYVVGVNAERLGIVRTARNTMFNLDPKPASTLIGVANLFKPEALIEVEMVVRAP
jgi:enamine deaminase RidA (YjgF/YER057c/UK114 family)